MTNHYIFVLKYIYIYIFQSKVHSFNLPRFKRKRSFISFRFSRLYNVISTIKPHRYYFSSHYTRGYFIRPFFSPHLNFLQPIRSPRFDKNFHNGKLPWPKSLLIEHLKNLKQNHLNNTFDFNTSKTIKMTTFFVIMIIFSFFIRSTPQLTREETRDLLCSHFQFKNLKRCNENVSPSPILKEVASNAEAVASYTLSTIAKSCITISVAALIYLIIVFLLRFIFKLSWAQAMTLMVSRGPWNHCIVHIYQRPEVPGIELPQQV